MLRRLIDILAALVLLVLTVPLQALIALLIKAGSPGPVLYAPTMIGWRGRPFRLYRFRTMAIAPHDLSPEQRLTWVGRVLREYSLDHLPMLFNLLMGDLPLVGPRPMEVAAVTLDDSRLQHYLAVKPGIINYAVLALGRDWTPSRQSQPQLNQELELHYLQWRTGRSDLRLLLRSLVGLIWSKGNIKVRKPPDPDAQ